MGNHRFKLSDMMPNAWFYKLRDMSKVRSHKNMQSNSRKFSDSRFPHEPPTKSTNKRANRKTVYTPSDPVSLSGFQYDIRDESYFSDIIIDVHEFHDPQLPPIQTKPGKHVLHNTSINFPPTRSRRTSTTPASRKSFSAGVKIRPYAGKKPEGRRRRNVEEDKKKGMFYSDSFAIVKASFDPEKDFKESMMEMIVENNIREAKDLEDLLACFLSLNSNQYHDLIIKAFEQIWFSMARLQS